MTNWFVPFISILIMNGCWMFDIEYLNGAENDQFLNIEKREKVINI